MNLQGLCPICRSPVRFGPLAVNLWEGEWPRYRCRKCGHRYHDPMPDSAVLKEMYKEDYYEKGGQCRSLIEGGYFNNEDNIRIEARKLLTYLKPSGGKLLEVGCAGGFFLDEARKVGFDTYGLELNSEMSNYASEELRLHVENKSVLDAHFDPWTFDVIVANRVLEHIPSIYEVMAKISSWLKFDGLFLVSGPFEQTTRTIIWCALNKLIRQSCKTFREPPYHVHGFTRKSWNILLSKSGFKSIHLKVINDFSNFRFRSWKDFIGTPIEALGWLADSVLGGGAFMISLAKSKGDQKQEPR